MSCFKGPEYEQVSWKQGGYFIYSDVTLKIPTWPLGSLIPNVFSGLYNITNGGRKKLIYSSTNIGRKNFILIWNKKCYLVPSVKNMSGINL